jgi:hypothetical protein
MKLKITFICLLFMGVPSLVGAQETSSFGGDIYTLGIKGGWQSSNMYRDGNSVYSDLNSFYIGFFNEVKASEKWSGSSGLEYFQNGFEGGGTNFKMHTISIPMAAKLYIGPVYGLVGVALNFRLSDNREDFPNIVTDTRFFDLPLSVGFGARINRFQFDAKYNYGLFSAANVNGRAYKNRYFQIGFGVYLKR